MRKAQPDHVYEIGNLAVDPVGHPRVGLRTVFRCRHCGALRRRVRESTRYVDSWSDDGGETWQARHFPCPRRVLEALGGLSL